MAGITDTRSFTISSKQSDGQTYLWHHQEMEKFHAPLWITECNHSYLVISWLIKVCLNINNYFFPLHLHVRLSLAPADQTTRYALMWTTLMSKRVWRASNHGDRHGHWHGESQRRPGTPRIPRCNPGWAIIDVPVTGHCSHCCITHTGDRFKE